jgi:hypothetical protein
MLDDAMLSLKAIHEEERDESITGLLALWDHRRPGCLVRVDTANRVAG